ncbi:MAG: hypothetical protein ACTSQP_24105, partial [Promethearchaeota archaeon]
MKHIITLLNKLRNDSLIKNSGYIYANTSLNALIGFIFWKIVTLRINEHEIGLAVSYITTGMLLSTLSDMGTSYAMFRLYAGETKKQTLFNTSSFIVLSSSFIISLLVIVIVFNYIPIFQVIRNNLMIASIFTFFILVSAINLLIKN